MILIDRTLLCVAALLLYGVEKTSAAPPWGRFERRLFNGNQTISTAAASSDASRDATQPSSVLLSSSILASETSSYTASDALTAQLSIASFLPGTTPTSSSTQQLYTLHGLETITTASRPSRPTTITLGSLTTTTPTPVQASSGLSSMVSEDISNSGSVSSSSDWTTTLAGSYANTTSNAAQSSVSTSNSSVSDSGWNSTTITITNLTIITGDVPPPTITTYDPQTRSVIVSDEPTTDACDVTTNSNTVTVWSTIYTTTITWTLPPEQYTPPFPTTTSTPVFCSQTSARLSVSVCDGSDCTQYTYPGDATTTSDDGHRHVNPTATAVTTTFSGGSADKLPTITFWTTDKNPAVVYSTETPPDYGDPGTTPIQDHHTPNSGNYPTSIPQYEKPTPSSSANSGGSNGGSNSSGNSGNGGSEGNGSGNNAGSGGSGGGNTAGGSGNGGGDSDGSGSNNGGENTVGGGGNGGGNTAKGEDGGGITQPVSEATRQLPTTATAVTVIIQTEKVIINDRTFTNNPRSATSTVVVGTDTFVINPSQVIGAGATVVRPVIGGIFIPTKTTTTVAGIEVVYTAIINSAVSVRSRIAVATIDGTTFTINTTPSTVVVKGQTITLGPSGIVFATQTIPVVTSVGATESAVLGGEMITAIGNSIVVIEGTTFSYGPGMSPITEVINGDTILIGPSGISVHGITLGGITAATTATTYEIVGGATITQIGGGAVVIDGTTYSIGASATSAITTVIDGQTLTIGPSGVAASSYTFAQPYVTSTVIEPGSTASVAVSTKIADSYGTTLRPEWDVRVVGICIAIGVGFLGGLLL
ncbi:hypothetical protein BKA67DRAFT_652790 [Truncatella angustata]|uniref:Uncharacterized protein n=1 Tax=Truncatella angustata TaxID=152316 RepID=A0A9P9A1I3_9PEZI|nr:uncharacterized protein BKA67DRAFT_652790 [Truncatella angustata]KAH6659566.1 hypothetical protein BKA67DRAFT_652790 [Truncatella angustata]